jgi:RHH-type proline utilization regulon transcriptional repressor/proline dehydrogenase/delta 1-pyrroline-5-carboxylate dehydrogenase
VSEVERAEQLASSLLLEAEARRRPRERRQAARMARLLSDPVGRETILALTDEVLRISDPERAAKLYAGLAAEPKSAAGFGPLDRVLFEAGARLAPRLPWLVVPAVRARVRNELAGVILPARPARLHRHIARRLHQGIRLNINVLGEAVLGEAEAQRRLGQVLKVLRDPQVDYVSVKISSICSQLDVLAFDHEVDRVANRLRALYEAAGADKFVNLDMEEYRDLDLTVAVFQKVLGAEPFRNTNAGIVLQAYLPDSTTAMIDLCEWARRRRADGGGWIKVRIVKGANLAMERVEAELQGWPAAPFDVKDDTDANYKRMLDIALDSANDGAVRVGVASHNLFELAWAHTQAEQRGASHRVEFEMLEGMSPAVAEAVAARFAALRLYAPIVAAGDLEAAIAYLVRRLDENSSPDNFITHQFGMELGSPAWRSEAGRFRRSVAAHQLPAPPVRRNQDRVTEVWKKREWFSNEPNTDFTRLPNRRWITRCLQDVNNSGLPEYRAIVSGRLTDEPARETGVDPSRTGAPAYAWASASIDTVEAAITAAKEGQGEWATRPAQERREVLMNVAGALARARGRLLAVMAAEAGKTVRQGDPEVSEAVDFASYYADHIPDPATGFRPYGTVVVVPPWNFPCSIPAGGVLAALAAGNTVILKPAPETVAVAGELVKALWAGGIPHAALHFVPCVDGEASRRLITHPDVDAVVLTGSWETARMFLDWRPSLNLHAETSGKNAIVVTATADPDEAITDLVASAFGHAGQKCSAASLAILEAAVFDDGRFLRRLTDAAESLRVGPAADLPTVVGPLIRPPEGALEKALHHLEAGERWLVPPRRLDGPGYLWRPGVKVGVEPGSFFHQTECFGPVLGVMRADDLEEAVQWQNGTPFGLTAGIQALDPAEIDFWRERVQAGNLYVNRGITGAIVGRQPFGGWKRSVVGPGAKAGGPNYVASLGTWPSAGPGSEPVGWPSLERPSDPTGLRAESNVFRYRPLRRVAVYGQDDRVAAAARAAGVDIVPVERIDQAVSRGVDKLRLLGPLDDGIRRAAYQTGLWVDDIPVAADPRQELLRWVREQAVSESRHRHGNVMRRRPGLLS